MFKEPVQPATGKAIRRFASHDDQRLEAYRYWQSRTPSERLLAVWEATVSAYAFKGIHLNADERSGELLFAFNENKVEYLVVGGYAVGVHAQPRATKDLGLFIRSDASNSEAVFRALAAFGAPLGDLSPKDFCSDPTSVFQVGVEPARIDLLQHIDGITFEQAWEHRIEASVDGVSVPIISSEDLIQNKLASNRPQDIADVAAIRDAIRSRQK